MHCKLNLKTSLKFLICWMIGYLTSCFMLNKTIYVNAKNGMVREEVGIFPFTLVTSRDDRAFSYLYRHVTKSGDIFKNNWIIVDRDTFNFSFRLPLGYTTGRKFITQQNTLIALQSEFDLNSKERRKVANIYYSYLEDGKYAEASEYIYNMVEAGSPNFENR